MADKDVTISQLVLQIDLLRSRVLDLERINAQLRADNQKLQDQIARLKRDSSNSSKPPSSDIVKPKKTGTPRGTRKRKIGGQKGHPRHERIPFAPDDIGSILAYELSPEQAKDLTPLDEWFVLQQVDLVAKPYVVTEHRARKYQDPRTGRIVIAPLPVAVKAAGRVGPPVVRHMASRRAHDRGGLCPLDESNPARVSPSGSASAVAFGGPNPGEPFPRRAGGQLLPVSDEAGDRADEQPDRTGDSTPRDRPSHHAGDARHTRTALV
jgi:hypothetical protein